MDAVTLDGPRASPTTTDPTGQVRTITSVLIADLVRANCPVHVQACLRAHRADAEVTFYRIEATVIAQAGEGAMTGAVLDAQVSIAGDVSIHSNRVVGARVYVHFPLGVMVRLSIETEAPLRVTAALSNDPIFDQAQAEVGHQITPRLHFANLFRAIPGLDVVFYVTAVVVAAEGFDEESIRHGPVDVIDRKVRDLSFSAIGAVSQHSARVHRADVTDVQIIGIHTVRLNADTANVAVDMQLLSWVVGADTDVPIRALDEHVDVAAHRHL